MKINAVVSTFALCAALGLSGPAFAQDARSINGQAVPENEIGVVQQICDSLANDADDIEADESTEDDTSTNNDNSTDSDNAAQNNELGGTADTLSFDADTITLASCQEGGFLDGAGGGMAAEGGVAVEGEMAAEGSMAAEGALMINGMEVPASERLLVENHCDSLDNDDDDIEAAESSTESDTDANNDNSTDSDSTGSGEQSELGGTADTATIDLSTITLASCIEAGLAD